MWNGFVLRELVQQAELSRFCLPIIHGCIFLYMSHFALRTLLLHYALHVSLSVGQSQKHADEIL